MKGIARFYHFLGSIYFAIILIATTALFVIAGTFFESATDSHHYAARLTYHNPFFKALLWGFFLNILFSSLRRWPFRARHIPFLITHLGLLMILTGTLIKSYWGTQGSMGIIEGSGSDQIFIPDTYIVQIEKQNPYHPFSTIKRQLELDPLASQETVFPDLQIKLLNRIPHSRERLETWIKGDKGVIAGFAPFSVFDWESFEKETPLLVSGYAELEGPEGNQWEIIAVRTTHVEELAQKAYLQGLSVRLTDNQSGKILRQENLSQALAAPLTWDEGEVTFHLQFENSPVLGLNDPTLFADFTFRSPLQHERMSIALEGPDSLLNENLSSPHLGSIPISVDLLRTPTLLFIQDLHEDVYLFIFDRYGRIDTQSFRQDNLNALVVYDQGFGGYFVQAPLPLLNYSKGRVEREKSHLLATAELLKKSLNEDSTSLSPPLQILHAACQKASADFADHCLAFLYLWDKHSGWLYSEKMELPSALKAVVNQLDWDKTSENEKKACYWLSALIPEIEKEMRQGQDLLSILSQRQWPLMKRLKQLKKTSGPCSSEETKVLLTALSQQFFTIADQLPPIPHDLKQMSAEKKAQMLSAYLRTYGIHLKEIGESEVNPSKDQQVVVLECPVSRNIQEAIPLLKLEDNLPGITLEVAEGSKKEIVTLTYDPYGMGLKWPVLEGHYLVRYQPRFDRIPYHIRLRTARQINYPGSFQPYSYESDLLITDSQRPGKPIEKTISMNNVYETWDGHRFYLANISPGEETGVKRIQLVVNHDPAKYILTYPGAILMSLGIILLFWMRPYK
jgi:hypothetical protein